MYDDTLNTLMNIRMTTIGIFFHYIILCLVIESISGKIGHTATFPASSYVVLL